MKRISAGRIILGVIVFLVLIQVIQPSRTNPPVVASRSLESHVDVPPRSSIGAQALLLRLPFQCNGVAVV